MRITFTNGSFIKLDGSDNVDALRGIKPRGLIVYDELKDHKKEFLDAMEPNRARYNAPALYLGTPPAIRNHYVDIMDRLKSDPGSLLVTAKSIDNHHNSIDWLMKRKALLEKAGELETWLREYEAVFVIGGKNSIFPWVNGAPRPKIADVLPKDLNKWTLIITNDPASTSTFGVTFKLFNPYTKKQIVFDEIYEQRMSEMTAKKMYEAINKKLHDWKDLWKSTGWVKSVEWVYDEAAAWFKNEVNEIAPDLWLYPSKKADFGVDGYIGLVKDIMMHDLLIVTENCVNWWSEHENYQRDEKGKIPKANDHLVNCQFYSSGHLGLDFSQTKQPESKKDERRGYSPQEDIFSKYSYADLEGI